MFEPSLHNNPKSNSPCRRVTSGVAPAHLCAAFFSVIILSMGAFSLIRAENNRWEQLDGPDGGFVFSLALSPQDPDVLYLGSDFYGGVYRSSDGGSNWEFKGMVSNAGQIIDIAVSPHSPDRVAAGANGIFLSSDGGDSWDHAGLRDTTVYAVAFDASDPDIIYAGTLKEEPPYDGYGVFRSDDGGGSWRSAGLEGYPVLSIHAQPGAPDTVYAGTGAGVFKSCDGCESWSAHLGPWGAVKSLAIDSTGVIFAGTRNDLADVGTIYRSGDGGASWDTVFTHGATIHDLAMDPGTPEIVYCAAGSYLDGAEGMFKTTNSGDTWAPVNEGLADRMAHAVVVEPGNPSRAWVGVDGLGGIYRTSDGAASWRHSASGLRHTVIQSLCFDSGDDLYAASGWGTYKDIPCIAKSTDGGANWESLAILPSAEYMISIWDLAAHPDNSGEVYVSGMYHTGDAPGDGIVYRTTDGGSGWEELWSPESLIVTSLALVDAVPAHAGDPCVILAGVVAATTDTLGVYRSADGGSTWERTTGWSGGNGAWSLTVHPVSPATIAAATNHGVFLSTDAGSTWERKIYSPVQAYTVLFDDVSPGCIYCGVGGPFVEGGGVFRSSDGGGTWSSAGLEEYSICALSGSFGPAGDTLYAGTGGALLSSPGYGIFRSLDRGDTWSPFSEGLDSPFILTFTRGTNGIYAGTPSGVYLLEASAGVESAEKPDAAQIPCTLAGNFPNPFNPATRIEFSIREEAFVSVKIYDIAGTLEKTLVRETKEAGVYSVGWDGCGNNGRLLPSGVYVCVLEAGGRSQSSRMVLIK